MRMRKLYRSSNLGISGRWIGTALMKKVNPPKVLGLFGLGGALASVGAILLPGMMGLISLVAISVFMSIMFPTIYGIALKDMGDDASLASAGLVMAIVGGALMPPMQGAMIDAAPIIGTIPSVKTSFLLPMLCFVVVSIYGFRAHKIYNA